MLLAGVFISLELFVPSVPARLRATANDLVSPVLMILAEPIRAVQNGAERIAGVSDIYLENASIREENERLKQWRAAAQRLLLENQRLRQIMNAPLKEIPTKVTGRVIGLGGGAFERSVLLDAGRRDGMVVNLPAIDESGLVGRTIEVGYLSSRVLLITDLNSRVPVRLERTGEVAIAEGQNEPHMLLRFLAADASIQVGDRVVTSGHGGLFPPDVPVAIVTEVIEDRILLDPLSPMGELDFVRVMDYQPLPPEREDETEPSQLQTGGAR